jgi:uncharacterized protein (TIGR02246 family)
MNRRAVRITAVALALLVVSGGRSAHAATDEELVRGLAAQFEQAWNSHDMNLLGAIATDDIDFVNVAGLHWKGRAEVVNEHAQRHQVRFRNSVWTTERVNLQFVTAAVALVHVEWSTRGDLDFDLKPWPPRKGIFSWLVVKDQGSWRIRSAQNTSRD